MNIFYDEQDIYGLHEGKWEMGRSNLIFVVNCSDCEDTGLVVISDNFTAFASLNYQFQKTLNFPVNGYGGLGANFNQWWQRQLDMDRLERNYFYEGKYYSWNRRSARNATPLYWDAPHFDFYGDQTNQRKNSMFGNFGLDYQISENLSADVVVRRRFNSFENNEIDEVHVIYNRFKTLASQDLIMEKVLPVDFTADYNATNYNYDYEPGQKEIVSTLIPKHINVQMWQQLLESYSSEEAARMIAMDNATENAKEIIKELKLEFNKARQAAITTEMLEIVGGAEALVD